MAARGSVLLYWPQLIGYARIALACAALPFTNTRPGVFTVLTATAMLLDMFDGIVARKFNQVGLGFLSSAGALRARFQCLICALRRNANTPAGAAVLKIWRAARRGRRQLSAHGELSQPLTGHADRPAPPLQILHCVAASLYPSWAAAFALSCCVEWCVLVATHASALQTGENWKSQASFRASLQCEPHARVQVVNRKPPAFLLAIFANNFKNPLGTTGGSSRAGTRGMACC
jgi:hypothetical protein